MFTLTTDSANEPFRKLILAARFVPGREVVVDEAPAPVRIGQTGHRRYMFIGRQQASEGQQPPIEMTAMGPIAIEGLVEPTRVEEADGITTTTRTAVVSLAAQSEPGTYQGSLALRWDDGEQRMIDVRWIVEPWVQVQPATLLLKPERGIEEVLITVSAAEQPVHILAISGAIIAEQVVLPEAAAQVHLLRVRLDPSRLEPGARPGLTITTDAAAQRQLEVGVLVLPTPTGEGR